MTLLRSILLAAVVGGALAGVLVTGLQALRLVPLILTAEDYERHGAAAGHADAREDGTHHGHESRALAAAGAEAPPDREEGWSPETPVQRTLATAFTNLLTAIGFGLLVAAALALSGGADWHRGLLWGLGGYAVFVLAPSISLPPSIPGMPEAAVETRQLWWLGTVAATAVGLYLLIRVRLWYGALLGALCLVLPHLIGAPAPPIEDGPMPADVVRAYIATAQATNLGVLDGARRRHRFPVGPPHPGPVPEPLSRAALRRADCRAFPAGGSLHTSRDPRFNIPGRG